MNYDTLFVFPNGRTARNQYIGAVIVLLLAFAVYYFYVPGRNGEWVKLTFLYPALVLHARRLRDMGQSVWLLIVPAAVLLATAYLYLFDPMNSAKSAVTWAGIAVSALFILWGLVGKSK